MMKTQQAAAVPVSGRRLSTIPGAPNISVTSPSIRPYAHEDVRRELRK